MTPTLHLTLLGKPQLHLDGTPLEKFRYKKSVALMVYLAVTGRPHSREALAGLLWGETTEANARAGLRKSLAELRGLVGEHLIIERQQLAFNVNTAYHLDVEDFQTQIERYRGRANSDLDPQQACALAGVLEVYQSDFLSDFHIRKAAAFEEWAAIQRERFRLDALRGLHMLADHNLTQGDYPQAIHHLERLLILEPSQEEAHRQMMSLLALDGQREAALRQYQTCCRLLRATLDVEPQAKTTALYERIRDQGQIQTSGLKLPIPLTPLIGRQDEIKEIGSRLADPSCRLLTVLGPGGSGKTHLVLGVGARLLEADSSIFEHGITFIPLNSLRSLSALPAALMHGLGLHFDKEAHPIQQLQEQLADQSRLIILDNFEHLLPPPQSPPIKKEQQAERSFPRPEGNAVEAASPDNTAPSTTVQRASDFRSGSLETLTHLLHSASGVKFLVTSRVRLNIQGEHILPLSGIAFPPANDEPDSGSHEKAFPAVELFIQRARQIDPCFEPDPATQEQIASICRQVAGLPLGILLAAGWSGLISPAEIAGRLDTDQSEPDNGLDFLAVHGGDLPDRHRSLRAVFAYSWDLLEPQQRATLAALSIFRSAFTLDAVQEIGAVILADLRTLADHSLVQRNPDGRYQLHEITRQFARQKVEDLTPLRARYCVYYTERLAQWAAEIRGAGQLGAIDALDLEIDNAGLAWNWAVERGDKSQIDQAIDGLCLYYDWRNRYPEGYTACEKLIQHLDDPQSLPNDWTPAEINRLLAKTLVWQSFFTPTKETEALLRRALACLDHPSTEKTDIRVERAFCLVQLARTPSQSNDQIAAQEMLAQSIKIFAEIGDRWGEANALRILGELLWGISSYKEAEKTLRRSLAIYQELGDRRGMAITLVFLGSTLLFQEQRQREGEQLLKESLALYADLGHKISMSEGFEQAISAMLVSGRYTEAHTLLVEKSTLEKGHGLRQYVTQTLLADTLILLGRYEEARSHAKIGLELSQRWGDPFILSIAMTDHGWLALVDGAYDSARSWFQDTAEYCREHNLKEPLSWALALLSFAHWRLDQPKEAARNFKQALLMAIEIESYVGIALALISGIPLIAARTSKELALTCYTALSVYPAVSNAQLFTDLIGGDIDAIKAELPLKKVARAEANGKKWDLEKIIRKILIRVR